MITLLLMFAMLVVVLFALAVLTGIIAVSPVVLVVVAFIALDVLVFKCIFKKKDK